MVGDDIVLPVVDSSVSLVPVCSIVMVLDIHSCIVLVVPNLELV